jgi:hypothetical protein
MADAPTRNLYGYQRQLIIQAIVAQYRIAETAGVTTNETDLLDPARAHLEQMKQNDRETLQLLLGHASAQQAVLDSGEGSSLEISGSAGSVRATVAPPRSIVHRGGLNSSQLQAAMTSRQLDVMGAARRHAESYSLSASQKQQQDEAKRLQSLMGKKALSENVDHH